MSSNPRRPYRFGALLAACGVFACAGASIRHITGPDGSPMLHVSCSDQGECFQLAGNECPMGYDLYPVNSTGRENFLVRCRVASSAQAVAVRPATAVPAQPPGGEQNANQWPPTGETSSLQQPWPPNLQASSTTPNPEAADAGTPGTPPPIGSIDIGY